MSSLFRIGALFKSRGATSRHRRQDHGGTGGRDAAVMDGGEEGATGPVSAGDDGAAAPVAATLTAPPTATAVVEDDVAPRSSLTVRGVPALVGQNQWVDDDGSGGGDRLPDRHSNDDGDVVMENLVAPIRPSLSPSQPAEEAQAAVAIATNVASAPQGRITTFTIPTTTTTTEVTTASNFSSLKAAPASNCRYNPASPNDRAMALNAVSRCSRLAWPTLPDEWQQDKHFVLTALGQHSNPLPHKSDFERKFPQSLRFDKDVVLAFCHRPDFDMLYHVRHLYVPGRLCGDKDVMMAYCRRIPRSLQECTEELCNDRDVVEAAISLGGAEFQYASMPLQEDKALVMKACDTYGGALEFCPANCQTRQELVQDKDFMINVVMAQPGWGTMLKLAPPNLQNDEDMLLQALKHGLSLRDVPPNLWTIEFVQIAIRGRAQLYLDLLNNHHYHHHHKPHIGWQHSPILALEAILAHDSTPEVHERALGLEGCSLLSENRQVVLAICHRGSIACLRRLVKGVGDGGSRFRDDHEIMIIAIRRDPDLFAEASSRLQAMPDIIMARMTTQTAREVLESVPSTTIQQYPDIAIHAIWLCCRTKLRHLPQHIPDDVWQTNRSVCIAWLARGGSVLDVFEETLHTDQELALQVALYKWNEFHKVGDTLLQDRSFMMKALAIDGRVYKFISTSIKDFETKIMAVANQYNYIYRDGGDGDGGGSGGNDYLNHVNNNIIMNDNGHAHHRLHRQEEEEEQRRRLRLDQHMYEQQQLYQPHPTLMTSPLAGVIHIPNLQMQIKRKLDLHETFLLDFLRGIAIPPPLRPFYKSTSSSNTAAATMASSSSLLSQTTAIKNSVETKSIMSSMVRRRSKLPKLDHYDSKTNISTIRNSNSNRIRRSRHRRALGSGGVISNLKQADEEREDVEIDDDEDDNDYDDDDDDSNDGSQGIAMLNRGVETSEAFKRLIAEYLGVPVGPQLTLIRRAYRNIQCPPPLTMKSTLTTSLSREPQFMNQLPQPRGPDARTAPAAGGGGVAGVGGVGGRAVAADAAVALRRERNRRLRDVARRHRAGRGDDNNRNNNNIHPPPPPPPLPADGGAGGVIVQAAAAAAAPDPARIGLEGTAEALMMTMPDFLRIHQHTMDRSILRPAIRQHRNVGAERERVRFEIFGSTDDVNNERNLELEESRRAEERMNRHNEQIRRLMAPQAVNNNINNGSTTTNSSSVTSTNTDNSTTNQNDIGLSPTDPILPLDELSATSSTVSSAAGGGSAAAAAPINDHQGNWVRLEHNLEFEDVINGIAADDNDDDISLFGEEETTDALDDAILSRLDE